MAMKNMVCPNCGYEQKVKSDVSLTTHNCHVSGKWEYIMIPKDADLKRANN